jgi:N-acetylneuraminic acid mutarotase
MEYDLLQVIGNVPNGRQGHTAVTINNVVYIFGGLGLNGAYYNDLYSFHYGNKKWSKIKGI